MRVYVATTLAGLAEFHTAGSIPASAERLVVPGGEESEEYAALMGAADASATLQEGPGRRVVVVAETSDPDGVVPMAAVVAVHADTRDRPVGADPDEDLAWFATQEIEHLLAGD